MSILPNTMRDHTPLACELLSHRVLVSDIVCQSSVFCFTQQLWARTAQHFYFTHSHCPFLDYLRRFSSSILLEVTSDLDLFYCTRVPHPYYFCLWNVDCMFDEVYIYTTIRWQHTPLFFRTKKERWKLFSRFWGMKIVLVVEFFPFEGPEKHICPLRIVEIWRKAVCLVVFYQTRSSGDVIPPKPFLAPIFLLIPFFEAWRSRWSQRFTTVDTPTREK